MHPELKMSLMHSLVIWSQCLPCLGTSMFLWLFLTKTKGEELSGNLLHCTPGKLLGPLHQSPLHTWGDLVYKDTEQYQISVFSCHPCIFNLQSWFHYFRHTLLCSVFLPSLKQTQQLPDSHYDDAPKQLTELQLLLHVPLRFWGVFCFIKEKFHAVFITLTTNEG